MVDHIKGRRAVFEFLRAELVGPSPQGEEIDCTGEVHFESASESYGPWRQKESGEEILLRDRPAKRYGVGVLYPYGTSLGDEDSATASDDGEISTGLGDNSDSTADDVITEEAVEDIERIGERSARKGSDQESDDLDLSSANTYRPSSMAVSFLAEIPTGSSLTVNAIGGRYVRKRVLVEGKERIWWLRSPVSLQEEFDISETDPERSVKLPASKSESTNADGLQLEITAFVRPHKIPGTRLITVCLINRTPTSATPDECSLFQSSFKAWIHASDGKPRILPYPRPPADQLDDEEQSLSLLYRDVETYAVGHGCAADWQADQAERKAVHVTAECMPAVETPSITPDIRKEDGTPLEVSMSVLAGLVPEDDGVATLQEIIDLYRDWIQKKRGQIASLDIRHHAAAERHLADCAECATRMQAGLDYLKSDHDAMRAFRLANHAVLLQQIHSRREPRRVRYDAKEGRIAFLEAYEEPSPLMPVDGKGKWRAFQIGFLLMALKSSAIPDDVDRRTVELIWFPTGGGKTEAYLGLAAFSAFMRRIKQPGDSGVHVIMRYTLRLLTAQQFQRASGLICAMEYLRRRSPEDLGEGEFSIGIWLGGSTTPNKRDEAVRKLAALVKGDKYAENPFVLNRCPWCGAHLGPLKYTGSATKGSPKVLGYERRGMTVVYKCPEPQCDFRDGLPVYSIDEDIYQVRPSLIIGTVDKFAMIAWLPEARALFGIGPDGKREFAPPGMIIQDELHLISGPLGSLVGLYEGLIEELCTDRRGGSPVFPKIVSSTATIRRYVEQIRALYGRDRVALFPAPGLDVEDSFFSRFAKSDNGELLPGRIYVGVHAPGLGSVQTAQVRTFTSLLQSVVEMSPVARDPWWTLLLFFNSLRELGTTLSLFQSDIPDYLKVLRNRLGIDLAQVRTLRNILELTGRLRSEEVPDAIAALELNCVSSKEPPVDVCLSSNIIEVGIDIDRLSLMCVVGQPKTTAQYIQVTGRVGRRWWERPGLVITIYGPSKPRDRSHFEKFRSYHESLYSQVEPTSVTPFSPPTLDRALHAVMVAYARMIGDDRVANSPYPYPGNLIDDLYQILLPRVMFVDGAEAENFHRVFERRSEQWRQWERTRWKGLIQAEDVPLLREPGAYVPPAWARLSWSTPMSMRNVDAECQAEITSLYLDEGSQEDA